MIIVGGFSDQAGAPFFIICGKSWINTRSGNFLIISDRSISGDLEYDSFEINWVLSETQINTSTDVFTLLNNTSIMLVNSGSETVYFEVPDQTVDVSGTVLFLTSPSS